MLKIIAVIAVVVVVVLAAGLVYAATRPDTFRVERALSIKAPPEKIFVLVNTLRDQGSGDEAHAQWSGRRQGRRL
jgi:uncharacterized protein involved in exopolysaccharide biosynthesis